MVDTESIHLSDIDCQSYHDNSYHDNLYETYSSDQQDHHQDEAVQYEPATPQQKPGKEIIYKSSKEMYKAVAKECGITCKMSDQCRCYDCQSRYFDCEYEQVNFYIFFLSSHFKNILLLNIYRNLFELNIIFFFEPKKG